MTTNARRCSILRLAGQMLGVLAIWLAATVALTAVAEPTRFAVVVGPPSRALAALAGSDTRIADAGRMTMVVQGTEPGFVRALYANGAWLVLPLRTGGCLAFDRNG